MTSFAVGHKFSSGVCCLWKT